VDNLKDIDLFQSIFQSSFEGIIVVDDDGKIIKVNAAFEKIFGYSAGALLNQPIERFILTKFKENEEFDLLKYIKQARQNQIIKNLDLWGLKNNGVEFPLKTTLNPTKIKDKRVVLLFITDNSAQKAKEELFTITNNALASASNGIVISNAQDSDLPIIYCNDAFTKITGYTKEEALGKNCRFLQNDDRSQKEIDILQNAIKNAETCNVTIRNYKKDGALFWNNITLTPIFSKEDTLTHFIGVQNEVTIKVKEENLKNQTRKILELIAQDKSLKEISIKIIETFETHFEDCLASILILDKEGKMDHRFEAPNLPKKYLNLFESAPIEASLSATKSDTSFQKEIIFLDIENNILWKDNKEIILKSELKSCWVFPILSSAKRILGTFVIYSKEAKKPLNEEKEIARDMIYLASIAIERQNNCIALNENKRELEKYAKELEGKEFKRNSELTTTVQKLVASNLSLEDQIQETKEAEKNAIASKTLTSAIAKNFPNGFIIVFNSNLKVLFLEGEAVAELGLDNIIFDTATVDDIPVFSDKQKEKLKQDIFKTIAGEHLRFEITYLNLYFSVNTIPLFNENTIISSALFVFSNITEQKKIEQEDKNALKKEQELNELKSRFVSMASHEFRTPLSAIQTSAILIGKQNEDGKEQKREKYVAQIKNNVKHLIVILNDFLSLSRLEEGKVTANKELLDLVDFSRILIEEISITKKEGKNIIFSAPNKSVSLFLDPKLVRHVLMNLLSNAIKYSPKNTVIKIKIRENLDFVSVKVQDQGIGIPKEEQDKLFERFFRAKNAQDIQGTGLGLNIVKQYVELMNGTISFQSEANKGSTFVVKLPRHATMKL
jgi:PAS domain S-box-containing protein